MFPTSNKNLNEKRKSSETTENGYVEYKLENKKASVSVSMVWETKKEEKKQIVSAVPKICDSKSGKKNQASVPVPTITFCRLLIEVDQMYGSLPTLQPPITRK